MGAWLLAYRLLPSCATWRVMFSVAQLDFWAESLGPTGNGSTLGGSMTKTGTREGLAPQLRRALEREASA